MYSTKYTYKIYVHIYVYIYVYRHVYAYLYTYCIYICVQLQSYIFLRTHTHIHPHTHTPTDTLAHIHACKCGLASGINQFDCFSCVYSDACMLINIHIYACTSIVFFNLHAGKRVHKNVHAHTQTRTNT